MLKRLVVSLCFLTPSICFADIGGLITPPHAPVKSIQFNNNGTFGGSNDLTYSSSAQTLNVTSMTATKDVTARKFFGDGSALTGISGGGGAGGGSSLAVGTGSAQAVNIVSSPTSIINLDSATFVIQLRGGATAYVKLAPFVSVDSITAQVVATSSNGFVGGGSTFTSIGFPTSDDCSSPPIYFGTALGGVERLTGIAGGGGAPVACTGGAVRGVFGINLSWSDQIKAPSYSGDSQTRPGYAFINSLSNGAGMGYAGSLGDIGRLFFSVNGKEAIRIVDSSGTFAFGGINPIGGFTISTSAKSNLPILVVSSGLILFQVTGSSVYANAPLVISSGMFTSSDVMVGGVSFTLHNATTDAKINSVSGGGGSDNLGSHVATMTVLFPFGTTTSSSVVLGSATFMGQITSTFGAILGGTTVQQLFTGHTLFVTGEANSTSTFRLGSVKFPGGSSASPGLWFGGDGIQSDRFTGFYRRGFRQTGWAESATDGSAGAGVWYGASDGHHVESGFSSFAPVFSAGEGSAIAPSFTFASGIQAGIWGAAANENFGIMMSQNGKDVQRWGLNNGIILGGPRGSGVGALGHEPFASGVTITTMPGIGQGDAMFAVSATSGVRIFDINPSTMNVFVPVSFSSGVFTSSTVIVGGVDFNVHNSTVDTKINSISGGAHVIQGNSTPFTQRTNLNFTGAGVSVSDDAGNSATVVNIPGVNAGSAGAYYFDETGNHVISTFTIPYVQGIYTNSFATVPVFASTPTFTGSPTFAGSSVAITMLFASSEMVKGQLIVQSTAIAYGGFFSSAGFSGGGSSFPWVNASIMFCNSLDGKNITATGLFQSTWVGTGGFKGYSSTEAWSNLGKVWADTVTASVVISTMNGFLGGGSTFSWLNLSGGTMSVKDGAFFLVFDTVPETSGLKLGVTAIVGNYVHIGGVGDNGSGGGGSGNFNSFQNPSTGTLSMGTIGGSGFGIANSTGLELGRPLQLTTWMSTVSVALGATGGNSKYVRNYDLYIGTPGAVSPGSIGYDCYVDSITNFNLALASVGANGLTWGSSVTARIFMGPGTYNLYGATIPQGIELVGNGLSTVFQDTGLPVQQLLTIYGKVSNMKISFHNNPFLVSKIIMSSFSQLNDVEISSAGARGAALPNTFNSGIYISTVTGVRINHLRLPDMRIEHPGDTSFRWGTAGAIYVNNSSDVVIQADYWDVGNHDGTQNAAVMGVHNSTDVFVINSKIVNLTQNGFFWYCGSEGGGFINNDVSLNAFAGGKGVIVLGTNDSEPQTGLSTGVVVANNRFRSFGGGGSNPVIHIAMTSDRGIVNAVRILNNTLITDGLNTLTFINIKNGGLKTEVRGNASYGAGTLITDAGVGTVRATNYQDGIVQESGSAHVIQDEGGGLTQRANLNFVGSGVLATDDAGNNATVVTISAGGGGTSPSFQNPSTGTLSMNGFGIANSTGIELGKFLQLTTWMSTVSASLGGSGITQDQANVITVSTWNALAPFQITASFNGGGSALAISSSEIVTIPYAGTISSFTITAPYISGSGEARVRIAKAASFGSGQTPTWTDICTARCPSISNGTVRVVDSTLGGFTTAVSANDNFVFSLDSAAVSVGSLTVQLNVKR